MRLTFHLTRRCNLKCTYCYAEVVDALPKPQVDTSHTVLDMSLATAKHAIEFGLKHSQNLLQIGFFGGEPGLKLNLIENIVQYAHQRCHELKKNVSFELTTNGSTLNARLIALIKKYHIITALSIDGPSNIHNLHRKLANGGDSFSLIETKIDQLLKAAPWTMAFAVVTPQTAKYFSQAMTYLLERGFKIVVSWPDQSANWTNQDLKTLTKQSKLLAKEYIRLTRTGKKFFLSSIDGAIRTHVQGNSTSCGAGEKHLSIGASGKIYPCVQFVGDESDTTWVLGNVYDGIDQEKQSQIIHHMRPSSPECGDCTLKERCNHDCPCANLTATGKPNLVSPIQCATQQMILPIADYAAQQLFKQKNALFMHKHYNPLYPIAHCLETLQTQESENV